MGFVETAKSNWKPNVVRQVVFNLSSQIFGYSLFPELLVSCEYISVLAFITLICSYLFTYFSPLDLEQENYQIHLFISGRVTDFVTESICLMKD